MPTGISQESPLLLILYLIYNSNLIDRCNERANLNIVGTRFIDDIDLLTVGNSIENNCNSLKRLYDKIYLSWATQYEFKFDLKKY